MLATGNHGVVKADATLREALGQLPESVAERLGWADDIMSSGPYAGALLEGDKDFVSAALRALADLPGPIVLPQAGDYRLDWLIEEVSTSINTTAAGGDTTLMAMV